MKVDDAHGGADQACSIVYHYSCRSLAWHNPGTAPIEWELGRIIPNTFRQDFIDLISQE